MIDHDDEPTAETDAPSAEVAQWWADQWAKQRLADDMFRALSALNSTTELPDEMSGNGEDQ